MKHITDVETNTDMCVICFSDNLSLEQTVEGSPSRPSIVELLEWLTNVENDYSELYPFLHQICPYFDWFVAQVDSAEKTEGIEHFLCRIAGF